MAGKLQKEFSFDLCAAVDVGVDAAPLLGFLYSSEMYASLERDSAAMGIDLTAVRERLALTYGFCSPEASLMMLYEPDQFVDNRVSCPADHPAFNAWKAKVAKDSAEPPALA